MTNGPSLSGFAGKIGPLDEGLDHQTSPRNIAQASVGLSTKGAAAWTLNASPPGNPQLGQLS